MTRERFRKIINNDGVNAELVTILRNLVNQEAVDELALDSAATAIEYLFQESLFDAF
jgi:hypothetical protein